MKSICMHGGFLYGDHTTGSYIASLSEKRCTYWITGSSTPCVAVFKPYWLIENEDFSFSEDEEAQAVEYWKERERFFRMVLENRIADLASYIAEQDELESECQKRMAALDRPGARTATFWQ